MEGPRKEEVTCPACFMRFSPAQGEDKAKCPGCGMVWRIPLSHDGRGGGDDREINPAVDKL
jgi:predicted RNA-binding Zn-ribbon protein involved in translation (DUF1610 family)